MVTLTITRLQVALLGCVLAFVSCLITPASHSENSQPCAFELPETLGTWKLLEEGSLQESELEILHATDHWRRVYRCSRTNHTVVVTLVAGPSGPLASHQPAVCYARNEFRLQNDAVTWTVPDRDDMFRFQTLEPRQIERPAMTIAYAWHDGDRWRAPRVPRIRLAGNAALQRLQITMRHPSGMAHDALGTMRQFVQLTVDASDELHRQLATLPPSSQNFKLTEKDEI
ncbi:exosortase-associated EpsI family protein [Aporhodopirellula aestuarii]|uniref:Exosortase-associated EpsI family protein n=1 Tax=Aporhodopirellula aestuarii TaxID=2950107 RepID=A0ABT0UFQ1_9BACT|nr:exosortase-associated EpsI family protein [Aporhodopirellula aestuarii]MCM2375130.1 exosortase-associated EpsI family protein [Aporhodopirellula aestuarii]